jgi:hypothetical protein
MTKSAISRPEALASAIVPPLTIEDIAQRILSLRGQRVILDTDLAAFYGESTKRFNQQVNRNLSRFPDGFMFQLDEEEFANLRLQFATSSLKSTHGGITRHDQAINHLMDSMQALLAPPTAPKRQIGFITDDAPLTNAKPKAFKSKTAKD